MPPSRLVVTLAPEERMLLQAMAKRLGVSMADVIRMQIRAEASKPLVRG